MALRMRRLWVSGDGREYTYAFPVGNGESGVMKLRGRGVRCVDVTYYEDPSVGFDLATWEAEQEARAYWWPWSETWQ